MVEAQRRRLRRPNKVNPSSAKAPAKLALAPCLPGIRQLQLPVSCELGAPEPVVTELLLPPAPSVACAPPVDTLPALVEGPPEAAIEPPVAATVPPVFK